MRWSAEADRELQRVYQWYKNKKRAIPAKVKLPAAKKKKRAGTTKVAQLLAAGVKKSEFEKVKAEASDRYSGMGLHSHAASATWKNLDSEEQAEFRERAKKKLDEGEKASSIPVSELDRIE